MMGWGLELKHSGHFRYLCAVIDRVIFEIGLKGMREWLLVYLKETVPGGGNSKSKGFGMLLEQRKAM